MENDRILNTARMLRRNLTDQERHLWYDFLQKYPVKIYKQKIIDNYIVDFYCHRAKLVIELDGSQHYTARGKECDEKRTAALEKHGLSVLRFSNKDVDERFEQVCYIIDQRIKEAVN
ncbi:MAG: endonuclease domain-containing protein [Clostridia bacterium]|nr:endonuclease domain-containing protein [Clostridia bacterium]